MIRSVLAVILGYVVLILCLFVLFTGVYVLAGANWAFKPGLYQPSLRWIVATTPLAFLAAIIGGYVCAWLARGGRAPLALAALVLVIGFLSAIPVLRAPATNEVRPGNLPSMEAMTKAKEPAGVALTNPLIGAVGVLVGSWLRRRRAGG